MMDKIIHDPSCQLAGHLTNSEVVPLTFSGHFKIEDCVPQYSGDVALLSSNIFGRLQPMAAADISCPGRS